MKDSRIQAFVDFIKFSMEVEGVGFDESLEASVRAVLDGDVSADEAVEAVIRNESLDDDFVPAEDENGYYPGTKSLINYFNIEERDRLREIEAKVVPIRMAEMMSRDIPDRFDFELLKEIHTTLFGDIYLSAGEVRHFDASRRTAFCKPEYIDQMALNIFGKLVSDRYLMDRDWEQFINDLAYYMGEVEALHPFFDGNGRAARVFFYLLVLNAGYDVRWDDVDPDRLLEADISAIDGEYQLLIDVLSKSVIQLYD
ncbi:MAG: Fic/DOC family protein [Sphaerochaetaceae bacterium]